MEDRQGESGVLDSGLGSVDSCASSFVSGAFTAEVIHWRIGTEVIWVQNNIRTLDDLCSKSADASLALDVCAVTSSCNEGVVIDKDMEGPDFAGLAIPKTSGADGFVVGRLVGLALVEISSALAAPLNIVSGTSIEVLHWLFLFARL